MNRNRKERREKSQNNNTQLPQMKTRRWKRTKKKSIPKQINNRISKQRMK